MPLYSTNGKLNGNGNGGLKGCCCGPEVVDCGETDCPDISWTVSGKAETYATDHEGNEYLTLVRNYTKRESNIVSCAVRAEYTGKRYSYDTSKIPWTPTGSSDVSGTHNPASFGTNNGCVENNDDYVYVGDCCLVLYAGVPSNDPVEPVVVRLPGTASLSINTRYDHRDGSGTYSGGFTLYNINVTATG